MSTAIGIVIYLFIIVLILKSIVKFDGPSDLGPCSVEIVYMAAATFLPLIILALIIDWLIKPKKVE